MKDVLLYTDGACSGNPGKGGWGAMLICNGIDKKFSGYLDLTTNNQMELLAVIEGLKRLKEPCNVNVYSDSAYVCNAFINGWINNWQSNGWKTSNKKEVQNKELWIQLLDLMQIHNVKFTKVKGHSDNTFNNTCDKLATDEIKKHN